MSTPAEITSAIPVVTAVPISPSAPQQQQQHSSSVPSHPAIPIEHDNDTTYFKPLSLMQYVYRFGQVYIGHFDTFLTITVISLLPAIVGYQWMRLGYMGSSMIFRYLLLPTTRLMADGAGVTSTALIYIYDDGPIKQSIPWKIAIQHGFQKRILSRWLLQALYSNLRRVLSPLGFFAFTTPILLLQQNSTLSGSLTQSARLVFFRSAGILVTTGFFTFGLTPLLAEIQHRVLNLFLPYLMTTTTTTNDATTSAENYYNNMNEKSQLYHIIALPLVSCLWTILYLDIGIRKSQDRLTRMTLANEMGVQLPFVVAVAH